VCEKKNRASRLRKKKATSSSQQPTVEEDFIIEENQEMDDPYNVSLSFNYFMIQFILFNFSLILSSEYINYVSQNVNVHGKSELDLYLTETPLEPKFFLKLDILSYWKDCQ